MNTSSAWGVKFTYTDVDGSVRTGLFGKYAFPFLPTRHPVQLGGYRTAVFQTRQQAREACYKFRECGLYDRVSAVRVVVTVEAWQD